MKAYTRTYFDYFGYETCDFIACEICEARAVDIHHIEARSKRKDLENDISNLMALCRNCHLQYGDVFELKNKLQEIHNKYLHK